MAGPVRGVAGPADRPFPQIAVVAAELPLGDFAFFRAAEGAAHVLEGVGNLHRIPDQDLLGILVAQIVPAPDRIIQMPLPAVCLHVSQRGGRPPLGGDGMGARRKNFGKNGRVHRPAGFQGPVKTGDSSANDYHFVFMNHLFLRESFNRRDRRARRD